eukprot:SAG22_NODE_227_length_14641_cov_11.007908_15_plen_325_part_00
MLQQYDFELDPARCPLHKQNDMLFPFETHKKMKRRCVPACLRAWAPGAERNGGHLAPPCAAPLPPPHLHARVSHLTGSSTSRTLVSARHGRAEWQCTKCNKLFRGEDFLDKHLAHKHIDLLPPDANSCVEDYCDILECGHDRRAQNGAPPPDCHAEHMYVVRDSHLGYSDHRCIPSQQVPCCVLDPACRRELRHKCEALMQKCVPPTGGGGGAGDGGADDAFPDGGGLKLAAEVNSALKRRVCGELHCRARKPSAADQAAAKRGSGGGVVAWFNSTRYAWAAMIGICMAVYYIVLLCSRGTRFGSNDLGGTRKRWQPWAKNKVY